MARAWRRSVSHCFTGVIDQQRKHEDGNEDATRRPAHLSTRYIQESTTVCLLYIWHGETALSSAFICRCRQDGEGGLISEGGHH